MGMINKKILETCATTMGMSSRPGREQKGKNKIRPKFGGRTGAGQSAPIDTRIIEVREGDRVRDTWAKVSFFLSVGSRSGRKRERGVGETSLKRGG